MKSVITSVLVGDCGQVVLERQAIILAFLVRDVHSALLRTGPTWVVRASHVFRSVPRRGWPATPSEHIRLHLCCLSRQVHKLVQKLVHEDLATVSDLPNLLLLVGIYDFSDDTGYLHDGIGSVFAKRAVCLNRVSKYCG